MDFEYKEPSHPFYLRPNAYPWATVAPTIVFYKKEPWLAMGSPGSERSLTAMAQFLERIVNKNENLDAAMRAPRLHCSLGGKVSLEAQRFDADLIQSLTKRGYRMDLRSPYSFYMGAIHAVLKKYTNQGFQGVAEVRRDGAVEGIND
jgi:gamma-glutamyltranspeptidase/glutathione hydrolase